MKGTVFKCESDAAFKIDCKTCWCSPSGEIECNDDVCDPITSTTTATELNDNNTDDVWQPSRHTGGNEIF